jgi:TRAP-type uncharacterized transport system substrate-binding protein
MKRSTLWICTLLLIASQAVTTSRAGAQAPDPNSATISPDPRAANPDARSLRHVLLAAARIRHTLRDEVNSGLVGMISGGLGDADFDEAADLAASLDRAPDGRLRLLPVIGRGALQNVDDIIFARGIDIGIVQSDVLAAVKRHPPFPGIERYLRYITRLYGEDVHVLAGKDIRSVSELAHKKVNFGPRDSGTYFTASAIFRTLGIPVTVTNFPQPVALEKLRIGEISAMVDVAGKPSRLFRNVRPDEGLHFLSVPATRDLISPSASCQGIIAGCAEAAGAAGAPENRNTAADAYISASLTAEDYPELIEADKPVRTIAVGTVLVTYNWPPGTERYRNVAHFARTFFERLRILQAPPHQPAWRDIDLKAAVPGWTRFAPAEQWIQKAELDGKGPHRPQQTAAAGAAGSLDPRQREALFTDFAAYLRRQSAAADGAGPLDPQQREALFADFAAYLQQQAGSGNSGAAKFRRSAREARRKDQQEGWPG